MPHLLILLLAVACGPTRTPTPTAPLPTSPFSLTTVPLTDFRIPTPPHPQTPTPGGPRELTICLADEPQSLYLYARPEPGRDHLLAALYDGPIDSHDYQYQPVLLTKLPNVAEGDAVINTVTVNMGDTVVDALGRVVTLTEGVPLAQLDGATTIYSGSGPISVPQMAVTFHLKSGVLWSDGESLTAGDSVFSYEVSLSPASYNPRRNLAEHTASYRALSETAVEWTGLPGYLDPLYFTNFWTPLPRHKYGRLKPAGIADNPEVNRNPLGWGPFVLREWVSGDQLTFERNPNYFRAAEGLPRLDRVTYRIIPADAATLLAELQSGACDVVPQNPAFDAASASLVTAWDTAVPPSLPDVRVAFTAGTMLEHLDFGIVPAEDYTRGAGNDFFQDAHVRQAFAYCLDRERFTRLVGSSPHRRGEPPATFLPAAHPLAAADVALPSLDSARGRALLAELGWADSDGDGTLDKDGVPLKLTLAGGPIGDPLREKLMGEIQTQLKANCGIEVETRLLTRGELEGDWPDGAVFGRRFDLAVFGRRVGSVPPCELFTTAQIPDDANPGGANDTGYSDPQFDAACRRALTTFDPQLAAQYHAEAQRLFAEDLPMLPLFFRVKAAAVRANIADFALDATSPSELWNVEGLSVVPR